MRSAAFYVRRAFRGLAALSSASTDFRYNSGTCLGDEEMQSKSFGAAEGRARAALRLRERREDELARLDAVAVTPEQFEERVEHAPELGHVAREQAEAGLEASRSRMPVA